MTSLSVLGTRIVFVGSLRGFCAGGAGTRGGAAGLFVPAARGGGGGGFGARGGGGGLDGGDGRAFEKGGGPGGGGGLGLLDTVEAMLSFGWRPSFVFDSTSILLSVLAAELTRV